MSEENIAKPFISSTLVPLGSHVDEMNGLAMVSSDIGKSCLCTRNCPRYFKHNETTWLSAFWLNESDVPNSVHVFIGLGLRDIFLSYTDLKPDRLPTMRNVVPVAADSSVRNDYYYFN